MKRKTILFISILQLLVITGCYDDLGNYDYTNSTKVSFVNSASSDYTFMVGDPVSYTHLTLPTTERV